MEVFQAVRLELDPNNYVRGLFVQYAGTARFAWNWGLSRRKELFNAKEGKEKFSDARKDIKELRRLKDSDPEFAWISSVSKWVPEITLQHLDEAFKNFWSLRSEGVGFPKFKKRGQCRDAFDLYQVFHNHLKERHIVLPRIGKVRLKQRLDLKWISEQEIRHVTVSREADRWFVSILLKLTCDEPAKVEGPVVGVDLGIKTFAVLSDGSSIEAPKPLARAQVQLRRLQRRLSRKKKGSKNRRKAAMKVARLHARVANIRKDSLHKATTILAKTKSVIVIEDLYVRGMLRNRHLSQAISDSAWGEFRRQLEYKTTWYGSQLLIADRFYASSKTCSSCGFKLDKLTLSIRTWICPSCGAEHDRDVNAAKNLELEGYRWINGNPDCKVRTSAEIVMAAELRRKARRSTSHRSLKQKASSLQGANLDAQDLQIKSTAK